MRANRHVTAHIGTSGHSIVTPSLLIVYELFRKVARKLRDTLRKISNFCNSHHSLAVSPNRHSHALPRTLSCVVTWLARQISCHGVNRFPCKYQGRITLMAKNMIVPPTKITAKNIAQMRSRTAAASIQSFFISSSLSASRRCSSSFWTRVFIMSRISCIALSSVLFFIAETPGVVI